MPRPHAFAGSALSGRSATRRAFVEVERSILGQGQLKWGGGLPEAYLDI
jgi:hypothetical protein